VRLLGTLTIDTALRPHIPDAAAAAVNGITIGWIVKSSTRR